MLSEAKRRANDKYIKSNWTQIGVRFRNGFIEDLREAYGASGEESMASYIQNAIEARMKADGYEIKHYTGKKDKKGKAEEE